LLGFLAASKRSDKSGYPVLVTLGNPVELQKQIFTVVTIANCCVE